MSRKQDSERASGHQAAVLEKTALKPPPRYKVLMHNDDTTPVEWVVHILTEIFAKSQSEAVALMLAIHNARKGVVGTYSFEIAEAKALQANRLSRQEGFALTCSIEEA